MDGELGLEAVRRERPGLVILDLRMPGMDGYTVVERLRADPELDGIPIVVLTAEEVDATGLARLGSRVSQFLRKGDFTFSGLTALVQSYFPGSL
jgi:CheY-like chemotaxis protein